MGVVSEEKCNRCPVRNRCSIACEPGSVMCIMNRLRSGSTHDDEIRETGGQCCPYCGRPLT